MAVSPLLAEFGSRESGVGSRESGVWEVWEVWGDGEMGRFVLRVIIGSDSNKVNKIVSLFPIPDSRFPIPDSRFPTPDSRLPIPDSQFLILNS
ncbi:hypothetical protein [Moorena sp. SIO3I6]|uniref:hypothetical protein n=1 Tax=Moorena sp. SIO3I6 TaxID=2607831 RepID=UPI0013FCC3BF|nr:hypothetical protein [Moorena sp. SIO3I6]NEP29025.1 hypothetical protein [Moorena sp. SIO3I6]